MTCLTKKICFVFFPQQSCHTLLYVYNLPTNRDSKSVSNRLRRLSDNCGGKVMSISGSSAILRFSNQESAERAHKRMENEDVFGNRIIVSFTPKNKELNETKNSNSVGAEKAKSPKKVNKNPKLCLLSKDSNDQSSNAKTTVGKGLQTHGSATKPTNVKTLQVPPFFSVLLCSAHVSRFAPFPSFYLYLPVLA